MRKRFIPELVSPAGDWPSLSAAIDAGADSVYFGLSGFNMRYFAANFEPRDLGRIMRQLHRKKRCGYLALNIMLKQVELGRVKKIMGQAKKAGVDAVVVWDMAALALAREQGLRVHISTQAGGANSGAVAEYARLGASRLVLARECTLRDIKAISRQLCKNNVNCELEGFIHGAMCISVSGRCFLSSYASGKSANRGQCEQPCRREFTVRDEQGEFLVGENYVLSAKDLCTIDILEALIESGLAAFKIEGRMRSPEYVGTVTSVYRQALDAYSQGALSAGKKKAWKRRLQEVFNRGFTTGFYLGYPEQAAGGVLEHECHKLFLGDVVNYYKKVGVAEILLRAGGLEKGQQLLFIGKNSGARFAVAEEIQQEHVAMVKAAKGSLVGVKTPFPVSRHDKVYRWQKRKG